MSLYYTDAQNQSTPLSVVTLNYQGEASSGYELWSSSTPVFLDGLTELLNLTFQATDVGQTYVETLNLPVTASGGPAPTLPSPPPPYATPKGFSDDITSWLSINVGSESETAFVRMFLNIDPAIAGAAEGTVVAARSGPSYTSTNPDYVCTSKTLHILLRYKLNRLGIQLGPGRIAHHGCCANALLGSYQG